MKLSVSCIGLFTIFICTLPSQAQPNHSIDKQFQSNEIVVRTVQYASVDYSNPIEIWEQEFEVGKTLSTIVDYSLLKKLFLDIYEPNDDLIRPVLLFIHGGAFIPGAGSKNNPSIKKVGYEFAQRGYRVFAIEYRTMNLLAPSFLKGGYTATQDAKAAIRYIANSSIALHINPHQIFVGGISAGACTALNAVFLEQNEPISGRENKLEKMYGCLDCVGEDSFVEYTILGVINISGGISDLSIVDNNDCALISFHGEKDNMVSIDCGIPFQKISTKYNSFLDQCANLASSYPLLMRELQEGQVIDICGSEEIHNRLLAQGKRSMLRKFPESDHYIILSSNNVFTEKGIEVIEDIANFMFAVIYSN